MAKDTISYEEAFGLPSTPAASTGTVSYEEAFGFPPTPPKRRTLASIAAGVNDLVIETANAAAGGVSAAANFVRPGNAVSGWIDKNIVEAGEASQSDATKAAKQRFRDGVSGADGVLDELGAVGRYVVENPGLAAAQAVGSFAGPGAAVKGGRTLASIAGLNAARGGLAGGAAAGAAMAGGDAAGTAYELASKAGATDEQAVAAGRQASVLPAVIGGVGGVVGAERLVAGAKGFAGNAASRALKTAAVEGAQEGIEEGVTQYEGQRAAMPYDKTIDPTKGVAAAAGMGAVLGGATGGGVSLLTGGHAADGAPLQQSEQAPALTQQAQPAIEPVAQPAIDPNAGPLSKAASLAGDLGLAPAPAAPTPEEQRAELEAAISRLPEDAQREARRELADADNEALPAGVRALRSARVQELANAAPAPEVELTPQDMERGRVLQNFDARAPELPPVADYAPLIDEMVLPERRAEFQNLLATATDTALPRAERDAAAEVLHATFSPDQLQQARPTPDKRFELRGTQPERFGNEIDFEQPLSTTPAPDAMAERINQLALDADLTPGQALQLNQAHALRRRASEQGITISVIPHPSGRGYDVAPTARLDPAARVAMQQDEAAAQLPYDRSPSGRMLAGQDGNARAESRSEAVARSNAAEAQRQEVEAERQRRAELGLSNITPVTPLTDVGIPASPRVSFDNEPTGRMVAGADGVRPEGRADVVNRANAPAPAPQTVTSASGAPFATRQAAQQELQRQQLTSSHVVAPAGGDESLGFVLRPRAGDQRAPNWRTNAMQANRIARGLGIETKGKRLAEVVAEIDAADVRTMMSNQDAATTTAPPTPSAPDFVAARADGASAVGGSTITQRGGQQQDYPPPSGPRSGVQPNQAPTQEQQAQAAIEKGADSAAAGPRAPAGNATAQQRDNFRAAEAKRTAPGARARAAAADANPFKAFIAKHGIALDQRREFAPGAAEQRQAMVPGYGPIFRKTGKPLDMLAQSAVEEGFLTSPDEAALYDLIGRALRGERIVAQYTAEAAEAEMQTRIARQREMEEDAVSAVAALTDAALFDLNDDEIVLTADSNTSTADFLRALGATDQEIEDAIAIERAAAQAGDQGRSRAQETDARPAQGSAGQGTQEAQPQRVERQDLLGDAPNEIQQAAARERARRQQQDGAQRNAAPGPEGFMLGMVDANTGREVDPSQGDLLSGIAEARPTGYSTNDGRAEEPTTPYGSPAGATGAAAADGVRGTGRAVPRRTASIVGLGIADRIERAGSQALVGQIVDSPQRLAELAQVYRDPRYETFRVFFLKGNEVVHATGVSARLPGQAPMVPAGMTFEEYLQEFRGNMERTGADGYYILHNHPSGNPTPSNADLRLTEDLAAQVPGMRAHVVINSSKYAVIEAGNTRASTQSMVQVKDFGEERLLKASKPMAALGEVIASPDNLATIGKSMQKPGWITLIGTAADGKVRAVAEAPSTILTRSNPYLSALVRRFMRQSGSASVFAVGEASDMNSKPVRSAVAAGVLRDAVPDVGRSLAEQGAAFGGPGFSDTPGRVVAENSPPSAGSQRQQGPRAEEPVSAYAARVGEALKSVTVTDLKQQAGFKAVDYRGLALQALGRRQLVDIYGGMLPEMRRYSDLMARMDADKNEAGSGADQLAQDWAKLSDERALAELMHDSTLAQIDPSRDFVEGDNKTDWTRLRARYNALTPGAKDVYARARDTYRQHMRDVRSAIKERIERTEISSERKAAMLKRMDDEFFGHIKGVYFPLARFGQYVVVVKDAEGKVANVSRAETMAEADASRGQLQRAFPSSKGYTVGKVLKAKDFVAERDSVGRGFMEQLYGVLDKQGMDTKARAELEDALGQLYLSSLPDLSWAKHGIHRKGTPGFSQDARRAFAQNVFHGASYLAKLRYGDRLQDELSAMQRRVDEQAGQEGFDQPKAQDVVSEMMKRHEAAMNPKTNALSTALTSLGFIFHLGLSPASAMVNLTQTALVAYPVMGAKWGFKKASAALLKASGEAARGKNDITGSLSPEEKAAFDEAVRSGVVDVTMAHDLAGIAQGEDQNVSYKLRPVMRAASWMFHHAEKFNRQITFVAAYRLARQAGAGDKAAYEQAVQATYDGHFDYSANNRPRVMQGNVARVVLLFKQYGQNMVYTLLRNAHQSLKGATPEQRSQARKALGGLLTMHGLAAGALGLPMVTTLLAAASMLGGDDDEPWDAQVALQNMLADAFGQKPAEVLAHGLSRLTPWDISGRVGLDKLIFPDVQEGLEGQRLGEAAMSAALGPVAGIGINTLKGMQLMGEGQYLRGLESMAPTVLRGPLKSWRYGTEGVRDKSGIVVQDEVDAASLIGQASGFSPSSVRNAYEGKSAIVQHDRALQARRSALVEQFAMAAMAGDEEGKAEAREAIAKFNEKNPNRRIQAMQLAQSVNMRQKRIREAEEGVYLPSKRRDALEAGRFAVPG